MSKIFKDCKWWCVQQMSVSSCFAPFLCLCRYSLIWQTQHHTSFETFSKFSYLDFQEYENARGSTCRVSSGGQGRSLGMSRHYIVEQNWWTTYIYIGITYIILHRFLIFEIKKFLYCSSKIKFLVVVIDDNDEDLQGLILI